MNFENFLNIIWKQPAAGQDGFEGLVAKLLERLTGQRFHLSRTGDQGGRDMASNYLMVECKKHLDSTDFKGDELLAKFSAAAQNSLKPDLWMVVTTKRLSDQHHNQLRLFSQEHGIAYFSIDAQGEGHSFLAALCAYAPKITIRHLEEFCDKYKGDKKKKYFQNSSEAEEYAQTLKDGFSSYLHALKEDQEVRAKTENLKQELSRQNIGYDHWRDTQNAWLCGRLRNKDESKAAFSQNLAVRAEGELFIPRKAAQEALDNWFANWPDQHEFFVVLGEEGDGKTWAVADWLYDKLSDNFSVIFLPSGMADCKELDILLPEIMAKQLREPYEGYWQKRLQRWQERPAGDTPLFLLVMDGLNERPDMEWRQLLAKFAVEPWCNRAAVLMTCRKKFWDEHLSATKTAVFTLGSYDNAELDKALAAKNLTRQDFDANLIDLLRIPRYFDLTVRLRERMDSEGEITRERLIYEDWRDKLGRKLDNSLSHEDFQELISNLSSRIQQDKRLLRRELHNELSGYGDSDSLLTEFSTGRVLERHGNGWTINRDYMILGLGLLLAYEAADALETKKNLAEVIAHFQEPQPDMDLKVSICAMALYHALGEKEWPEEIHLALFNAWVSERNIKEEDWWRITAYLPVRPEIYLRMMEQEWLSDTDHIYLRNTLKDRFLYFSKNDTVQQVLTPAFERWMGFVHHQGHKRSFNDEKIREEGKKHVQEALGNNFSGKLFDCSLTVIEDEKLLWLSKLVLTIISNQPRNPYIRAIVTGVVAGAVMGYPHFADDLSWVLRTVKDDIEGVFLQEAEKLLNCPEPVAQKAAWWLLNSLGTEKAWQLRDKVPSEYHGIHEKKEPCRRYLFSEENYLDCIEKLRDKPVLIVEHLSSVALNPAYGVPNNLLTYFTESGKNIDKSKVHSIMGTTSEDFQLSKIEPALYAYCPERFAEIINELARQLPERSGMARRSLSWQIYEHILILNETSREAVDRAWRSSLANAEDENYRVAEEVLFPCVLRGRTLEQQLDLLEERWSYCKQPEDYHWFTDHYPFIERIDFSKKAPLAEKLKKISSPSQRYNFLFSLAPSIVELDEQVMSLLPELSEVDNSFTLCYALQIIYRSKNQKAIQSVLQSDWSSDSAGSNDECAWGSWLLAEYGQKLLFAEISRRVSPNHLGYAVKKRGFKPEEVVAYGEILNLRMPDSHVQTDALAEVIKLCPEYVGQWVEAGIDHNMIRHRQFFYESLCEVILEKQPEQGKRLFWKLHRNKINRIAEFVFSAGDSTEVLSIRHSLLKKAVTDNDLFEITFLAQKHDRNEWLEEVITTYLDSDFALDNAKGLFLLGFMDDSSDSERLDVWIAEKKPSWLRSCAEQAKIIHERNQWAHHWFERFITHKETLQAWAAFRLFLRCVDRRFWLWGKKMICSPDVPYERFEHYRACRESIVKAIKENEEESPFNLKDHLVGWKVQENQLWPWLGRYLSEDDAQA
uniref:hypothetical protein n=1 Tax=Candidatus Electronema sp. TaxID=2698783 RepID=UPI004056C0A2